MADLTVNGRRVSEDEYERHWLEVFANDPVMQSLNWEQGERRWAPKRNDPNIAAAQRRAEELGFQPPNNDWRFVAKDNGTYGIDRKDFVERNQNWITPALIAPAAIGGVAALAAGGGAAASGAGAAGGAGGSVPAAGATLGPGVGFGAGGAPVASAGFASGGGALTGAGTAAGIIGPVVSSKDFWGKTLFGLGGDLLNGYLNNRSANNAADELIKAGDKQVALYDKALGPYMDPGPLNALKFLSGLPAGGSPVQGSTTGTPVPGTGPTANANGGRLAPPGAPSLGTAGPRPGRLASLTGATPQAQAQQQQASSYVRMVSPDGEEGSVHPSQVQNAIQAGARPLAMGRG